MRFDLFERLKTYKGYTQSKLSQDVGITKSSLATWKNRGYSSVYIKKKMLNYMLGQNHQLKNVEKHWYQCEECFNYDTRVFALENFICRDCYDNKLITKEEQGHI